MYQRHDVTWWNSILFKKHSCLYCFHHRLQIHCEHNQDKSFIYDVWMFFSRSFTHLCLLLSCHTFTLWCTFCAVGDSKERPSVTTPVTYSFFCICHLGPSYNAQTTRKALWHCWDFYMLLLCSCWHRFLPTMTLNKALWWPVSRRKPSLVSEVLRRESEQLSHWATVCVWESEKENRMAERKCGEDGNTREQLEWKGPLRTREGMQQREEELLMGIL